MPQPHRVPDHSREQGKGLKGNVVEILTRALNAKERDASAVARQSAGT